MPITSNTARIGPPAMMPVPSIAGCISTLAAPCRPITACCSVPFFSFTLKSLCRASSIAFCTATGTSRALPLPMPMPPSPSLTTVSAAKPSTWPPFTTLVTRLTATIFSRRPLPRSSDCCIRGWIFAIRVLDPDSLEFKSGGARRLRERLHAPMVFIAGAVEGNLLDAVFLRLGGDALADDLGGLAVAAVLQLGPDVLLQRGSACDDLVARSGRELGIDMAVGAMHGETHRPDGADPEPGLACAPQAREVLVDHGLPGYFFLVSFKMMISPL